MNKSIFFIFLFGISINSIAQQIPLKGVVTVQNSETYTGKVQYVKNAEVIHPNAKNDVTDDDGKFTLEITGLKQNTQTQITVIPRGAHNDYVVVNEKELQSITLGRITPIDVYICKKGELEQRRVEMVGVNMKKYRDQIERLQKELNKLKDKYDYSSSQYKILESQIDSLNKAEKDMYSLITEWAKSLTLINLDNASEMYVKAYNCFAKGELDSIGIYLPDEWLRQKKEQLLQEKKEGEHEIEIGRVLQENGQLKIENANTGLADNANSWMLKAKEMALKYKYNQAITYYEEAISADSLNADNIFEFAKYLYEIREYTKAEKYYQQCLEIFKALEEENAKAYLPNVARTLHNLGALHSNINEYTKVLDEYEESLKIHRKLAEENPKAYLPDVAKTLNNLGVVHKNINEYTKALDEYEEALKIYRKLAEENPKAYLPDVAMTLNNLGNLHRNTNEYPKALDEFEEALKIRRKLAEENPKAYLPDVAATLNNLGNLHKNINEYTKALEELEEALKIRRKLAKENPKAYLPYVAKTLNNLGVVHQNINEYPKALEEYEEALKIFRNLAEKKPDDFPSDVYNVSYNIYLIYHQTKDYSKSIYYLNTLNDMLVKYKEQIDYKPQFAQNYGDLSWRHLFTKEYSKSEQSAREALKLNSASIAKINLAHALLFQNRFSEAEVVYKELSQTIYKDNETYTQSLLDDFNEFEEANVIPAERKADVEKIKGLLQKEKQKAKR